MVARLEWIFCVFPILQDNRERPELDGPHSTEMVLRACTLLEYILANRQAPSAFEDARKYLELLSEEEQKIVLVGVWDAVQLPPESADSMVSR